MRRSGRRKFSKFFDTQLLTFFLDRCRALGGIARNFPVDPLLLSHDEETLRFAIAAGEELLLKLLTGAETEYWELVDARATKYRAGLSSMLRKAKNQGLIEQLPDKSY